MEDMTVRIPAASVEGMLTVRQVAERYQVKRGTVWKWVSQGRLPAVRIGQGFFIPEAELAGFKRPEIGRPIIHGRRSRKNRQRVPA